MFSHANYFLFPSCLITDYFGTLSRRTLSVRDAEATLVVVSLFTLAHSVVCGQALLFHHSVSLADRAVQALVQKVPELCEVFLRTGQAHGVEGASARRRDVCPWRAECTQQCVARIAVLIFEGKFFHRVGIGGHQEQKQCHWGQLGEKARESNAGSWGKASYPVLYWQCIFYKNALLK